jgi:4'-phosphopantetheinyl transferase
VEMCASVRECPASGKSHDEAARALARIAQRVAVTDPDVKIWCVLLAVSAPELEQLSALLSSAEQTRAARFHFARDRSRYVAARGMLRVMLGNFLGIAPAAVALESGPYGKPLLADSFSDVHFNLTHSGDLALIAIARDLIPGVDIESLDRDVDYDGLARRFFCVREYAELQLIPEAYRKRAFLACWTRKEAVAKAVGQGLHLPLNRIEVTVGTDAPPRLLDVPGDDPANWTLHGIDAGRDYIATLASRRVT